MRPAPIVPPLAGVLGLAFLLASPAASAGDPAALAKEEKAAIAERKAEALEAEAAANGAEAEPAPEQTLTAAEAEAVDPEGQKPLEDPLTCLARTVYWEAKGEERIAMEAVANVVMNRLASPDFPDTICAVVQEGRPDGPCQFSWWCDGNPLEVEEPDRYAKTTEIARLALNQELADHTDGALFFHNVAVSPDWAEVFLATTEIGAHRFYRPDEG